MNKSLPPFQFKQFTVAHQKSVFKVGTDAVILGAWSNIETANSILDIGTGSGLIALISAQRNQNAKIIGVELDKASSSEALWNFRNSKWSKRLSIYNIAIQQFAQNEDFKFDHIVSNPPFFQNSTKSQKANKNNARHTDTLSFLDLIISSKKLLNINGRLSIVLPYANAQKFIDLAKENGLFLQRLLQTKPRENKNTDRYFMEFSTKLFENYHIKTLSIRETNSNNFTEEYKELTKEFYLNF